MTLKKNCEPDEHWMSKAIELAHKAEENEEVPVGAVLIDKTGVISTGYNCPITSNDPTAHAEIQALRNGSQTIGNYRLPGTTLFVTLEPCIMCMGAIIHARIDRLVFGAYDQKGGAAGSLYSIGTDSLLNHQLEITGGVLQDKCATLLRDFFKKRRK